MSAVNQVLAQVDTDGKVLVSSVDLGLESLMVVHEQLDTGHVTGSHRHNHLTFSHGTTNEDFHAPPSTWTPSHHILKLRCDLDL